MLYANRTKERIIGFFINSTISLENNILPILGTESNGSRLLVLGFQLGDMSELDHYVRSSTPLENLRIFNLSYVGASSAGISNLGNRLQRPARFISDNLNLLKVPYKKQR